MEGSQLHIFKMIKLVSQERRNAWKPVKIAQFCREALDHEFKAELPEIVLVTVGIDLLLFRGIFRILVNVTRDVAILGLAANLDGLGLRCYTILLCIFKRGNFFDELLG
jgi:hypothetical protein